MSIIKILSIVTLINYCIALSPACYQATVESVYWGSLRPVEFGFVTLFSLCNTFSIQNFIGTQTSKAHYVAALVEAGLGDVALCCF